MTSTFLRRACEGAIPSSAAPGVTKLSSGQCSCDTLGVSAAADQLPGGHPRPDAQSIHAAGGTP